SRCRSCSSRVSLIFFVYMENSTATPDKVLDFTKPHCHWHASIFNRRPGLLLVSLLIFFALEPVFEKDRIGSGFLVALTFFPIFAAALELSARSLRRWPGILLATGAAGLTIISYRHPIPAVLIAKWALLSGFFGAVAVGLFSYLGQPDADSRDRLSVSVSLYLILGMSWFALFNLLETINPGSFA